MTNKFRCSFRADVITRQRQRVPNQQCIATENHQDEHEFLVGEDHIFGVSFNRKKKVYEARR